MNHKNIYFQKPVKRIDVHVHLGIPGNEKGCFTAEERIQIDEILGIEYGIILPYPMGNKDDEDGGVLGNEGAREIAQKYPNHFGWFCNVVPSDEETMYAEMKKYKEEGACGVGEFGTKVPFDDEQVDGLLRICAELNMPFLFHISPGGMSQYGIIDNPGLPLLEKALEKHPDTLFIGHSQPFWYELGTYDKDLPIPALNGFPFDRVKEEGRTVALMRRFPNLYADLSANSGSNAILRDIDYGLKFLDEFQDRLLFGSDLLDTEVIFPIGQMLDYFLLSKKISEEAYTKICHSNAKRILKI